MKTKKTTVELLECMKNKWDYKQGEYQNICCTCLNFIEDAKSRGIYIGDCLCYGITISAFDKCGSWQDDA